MAHCFAQKHTGRAAIDVSQPGGLIRAEAAADNGVITEVFITGKVSLGDMKQYVPSSGLS